MKTIFILIFLIGCWNDKPEPEFCYHCTSPEMPDVTFCGVTESEMQHTIDWRAEYMADTLICVKQ